MSETNKRKRDENEESAFQQEQIKTPTTVTNDSSKEKGNKMLEKIFYTVQQLSQSDKVRMEHIRRGCMHHEHGLTIFRKPNAHNIPTDLQVSLVQLDAKTLQPDPTKEPIVLYFHSWEVFKKSKLFQETVKCTFDNQAGKRVERVQFTSPSMEALLIFAFSFYCSHAFDEFSADHLSKVDGSEIAKPSRDKPLEKISKHVLVEVWKLSVYWKMFDVLKKASKMIEEVLLDSHTTFEECVEWHQELELVLDPFLKIESNLKKPSGYYCYIKKHTDKCPPIVELADEAYFADNLIDIFANVFLSRHWSMIRTEKRHGAISIDMLVHMAASYSNRLEFCLICKTPCLSLPDPVSFILFFCKTLSENGEDHTFVNRLDYLILHLQKTAKSTIFHDLSVGFTKLFGRVQDLSLENSLIELTLMRKLLQNNAPLLSDL